MTLRETCAVTIMKKSKTIMNIMKLRVTVLSRMNKTEVLKDQVSNYQIGFIKSIQRKIANLDVIDSTEDGSVTKSSAWQLNGVSLVKLANLVFPIFTLEMRLVKRFNQVTRFAW